MGEQEGKIRINFLLDEIKKLLITIESHKGEKLSKNVSKDLLGRFKSLQENMTTFRKFNSEFYQQMGITDTELNQGMMRLPKGSEAEQIFQKSQRMKAEILLSYAKFLQKTYEGTKKSPLFNQESVASNPEVNKTANKKKFKSMNQRLKWKKM